MHQEIRELLGVYALDALDPDERRLVDYHLAECIECRQEAGEHREVAGRLGLAREEPPVDTWNSIAAEMSAAVVAEPSPSSDPSDRGWRVFTPYVIALALMMAILSVVFIAQGFRIGSSAADLDQPTIDELAASAVTDPEASLYALTTDVGTTTALVAVMPGGTGYLARHTLVPLPEGETYQLWALGDNVVSAGILGRNPGVVAFSVDPATDGFAITREVAGGVAMSENEPIVAGLGTRPDGKDR